MSPEDALRAPLVLVVAVSRNGVIGKDGGLPWHIPGDLKHFKRNTMGHAIIMGRRTWESIGRPLPGRRNIVVSRRRDLEIPGCEVAHDLDEALALARTEDDAPRVIGGASLYEEALPRATRLLLTEVDRDVEGDTFFPEFERSEWVEVEREEGDGVTFLTLERRV
ncbi:MAG: dihydrofolate reductase [Myxococcota bacterium]